MFQRIVDSIFVWGAHTIVPTWCQSETHWTAKLVDFLWVDCPCCLMFRGIVVGGVLASCAWAPIIVYLAMSR